MAERGGTLDRWICFVGDSYVAGVGDSGALGWVGRVSAAAAAVGFSLTSYNLGVRGQTGPQVAARVSLEVPPRLESADNPRLVVSFGANDTVVMNGRRRTTLSESVAALEHVCTAHNVPVFVVGPPAVQDDAQNDRLKELDTVLHTTASQLGAPYLELFTATHASPLWQLEIANGDGFHPSAAGYELLAEIAERPILRWLR